MKYKIPIQQQIKVWVSVDAIIETDDTAEDVLRHLREGDFLSTYDADELNYEVNWETEEVLESDYGFTTLNDIEEI